MPEYEWTGDGEFRDGRNDRTVEPGATVELDEHVGEPNDELVRVEDPEDEIDDDGPTETDSDAESWADGEEKIREAVSFEPGEHTVDEIRELAADVDNDDELAAIAELERDGENRTTALEAIDEARE